MMHEIHCGLLSLSHRFIVIDWNSTRWVIPASVAVDFGVAYYEDEDHGWYEPCELAEDASLTQPHGEELRGCVEVNSDLAQVIRDEQWRKVKQYATKSGEAPDPDDQGWWFEENGGTIEEMTDLPIEDQIPLRLLWFDEEFRRVHNIQVA